jgi:putative FmdB family regulatory protein
VPRYGFRCRACGLEFEVSRAMSDAGRDAACPADGKVADRLFTAPMISVRQGAAAAPATPPDGGGTSRTWSLPFFPKDAATSAKAHAAAAKPRHILPAGSSKPTRFKHFGHWHPAGTPPHTHPPRRSRRAKPAAPPEG